MTKDKATLGLLLRALRTRRGLTLKEMSTQTGIPFSTLSKVEHDRLTLTYDKLQMISERLNIPMAELFAPPNGTARNEVMGRRSIGALDTALRVDTPSYDYYYISPEFRQKQMIPIIARVKAKSLAEFGDLISHHGEEFIYVLQGPIVVHTEFYEPFTLNNGQSIYLDSTMGHAYTVGKGVDTALMLSVSSSSQEELIAKMGELRSRARSTAVARPTVVRKPRSAARRKQLRQA